MKALGRMKLWQKLAILVTGLLIPTILASGFYFATVSQGLKVTRAEVDGATYLQPLGAVLAEILSHRGAAHALLNGDTSQKDAVAASESRMDSLLNAVDTVDASLDAKFHTASSWAAIKSD